MEVENLVEISLTFFVPSIHRGGALNVINGHCQVDGLNGNGIYYTSGAGSPLALVCKTSVLFW